MSGKVSFTIRRPSPLSRASSSDREFKVPSLPRHLSGGSGTNSPLARSATSSPKPNSRTFQHRDSDSDNSGEDEGEDELVTGFDQFGVQRLNEKRKAPTGPLVIPALQNRDWREIAKKRKNTTRYAPASAAATTGADGSVGGLGTRDMINSGPVVSGLQVKQKRVKVEIELDSNDVEMETKVVEEETEDQKAIRALLSGSDTLESDGPIVEIIKPVSEDDAYRQDIGGLPDEATLEDYARVPVSQFGAALLRGMGWKEGSAATRRQGKNGMVEPWVPSARPALLGIGAKERELVDDGRNAKEKSRSKKPDMRYVPVVKQDREGSRSSPGTPSASRSASRRNSRSPSPGKKYDRRDKRSYDDDDRDRRRHKDRERDYDRRRDRSRESNRTRHDY